MSPDSEHLHIARLVVQGFKRFAKLDVQLHSQFCVIVGDNETGKSSILEAINLVLRGQYQGRLIQYALDPYLFNADVVAGFFTTLRAGGNQSPPEILVEAYLAPSDLTEQVAKLSGTHNSRDDDRRRP